MSLSSEQLEAHYREVMAKGSKSFSLAALLFDRERREAARELYSWCRYCDDAIDSAPSRSAAENALASLRNQTRAAIDGERLPHPAFLAFGRLCRDYQIPALYPLELLEGMRMDVEAFSFETERELRLYCYRVAGVVGLMMVHIMGVNSEAALAPALSTGLAMQMTNIARDIREDYEMGRIYIPTAWFTEAGLQKPDPSRDAFDSAKFVVVTERLLREADRLYTEGRSGLRFLPARAAFAVAAAQQIYRAIGSLVLERGAKAWDQRAVVSLARKLTLAARAISQALRATAFRKWKPVKQLALCSPDQL